MPHSPPPYPGQPVAAPAAPPPALPPLATRGVVYATFGQRLSAWAIDTIILAAIQVGVLVAFGMLAMATDTAGPDADTVHGVLGLVMMACAALVGWPYYALMEASQAQATIGKRVMGIRVEDVDGGNATFIQTSFRFFLRIVSVLTLGFGYLMALFTARRQTLHDIGANCLVTMTPRTPPG
jgi:uncharacterized RDD family membrane protein YckC